MTKRNQNVIMEQSSKLLDRPVARPFRIGKKSRLSAHPAEILRAWVGSIYRNELLLLVVGAVNLRFQCSLTLKKIPPDM